jgi:hypothetical protein
MVAAASTTLLVAGSLASLAAREILFEWDAPCGPSDRSCGVTDRQQGEHRRLAA